VRGIWGRMLRRYRSSKIASISAANIGVTLAHPGGPTDAASASPTKPCTRRPASAIGAWSERGRSDTRGCADQVDSALRGLILAWSWTWSELGSPGAHGATSDDMWSSKVPGRSHWSAGAGHS
jgi:hypothetical protein